VLCEVAFRTPDSSWPHSNGPCNDRVVGLDVEVVDRQKWHGRTASSLFRPHVPALWVRSESFSQCIRGW